MGGNREKGQPVGFWRLTTIIDVMGTRPDAHAQTGRFQNKKKFRSARDHMARLDLMRTGNEHILALQQKTLSFSLWTCAWINNISELLLSFLLYFSIRAILEKFKGKFSLLLLLLVFSSRSQQMFQLHSSKLIGAVRLLTRAGTHGGEGADCRKSGSQIWRRTQECVGEGQLQQSRCAI